MSIRRLSACLWLTAVTSLYGSEGTSVQKESFGRTGDGDEVTLYVMTNLNRLRAGVIDYGASLVSLVVPDRDGKLADIALGFDNLEGYLNRNFGGTTGRFANRIGGAKFTLDGTEYKLTPNSRGNHIHGGRNGFNKVMWKGKEFRNSEGAGVALSYLSKDGEEGYPGNLNCTVTYTLTDSDELRISYRATTDKPTVINLTNHGYYNLAGAGNGDVLNHVVMINAIRYTPADKDLIPTGELRSVTNTPLDFTKPITIGSRIDQLTQTRGYDHNYVFDGWDGSPALAVRVYEPTTGRVMWAYTTEPGMQFYTANHVKNMAGRDGKVYHQHYGFCLETQHFPDSPNKPNFPSVVLRPGETFDSMTVFKFSTQ